MKYGAGKLHFMPCLCAVCVEVSDNKNHWLKNSGVCVRAETDVRGLRREEGEKKSLFLGLKKTKNNQADCWYSRLQVFHKQSLDYSAQGHSRCEVSEFQTEEKENKCVLKTQPHPAGLWK